MKDWPPLHADADAELERADDLLDDYTYGLIIAFGSGDAI